MLKLTTMSVMVALSIALVGCYKSGSESSPPPAVPLPPVGIAKDGSTYYQNDCAVCHKAGLDDTTTAFGASDLSQRQDMIAADMSNYDATSTYKLMLAFTNVPTQRVADLKAYLKSVPRI